MSRSQHLVHAVAQVASTPEGQKVLKQGARLLGVLLGLSDDSRRLRRVEQRLRRLEQERQATLKQLREAQRLNREAQGTLDALHDAWKACEADADLDKAH